MSRVSRGSVGENSDAGTIDQLTERERRLAEVEAKLARARGVQAEAERQLECLDGLLREEGMTMGEWRRLAAGARERG